MTKIQRLQKTFQDKHNTVKRFIFFKTGTNEDLRQESFLATWTGLLKDPNATDGFLRTRKSVVIEVDLNSPTVSPGETPVAEEAPVHEEPIENAVGVAAEVEIEAESEPVSPAIAGDEPESAANIMHANTEAMASPPWK